MISLSNFKNIKITEVLAKTAGLSGLALIAYDSHYAGKTQASMDEKNEKATSLTTHYIADTKLDSPSVVKSAVKKNIFKFHLDENLSNFFINLNGYVKGAFSMLVGSIIPLGLATGAAFTKGALSKTFGLGLLAYGGIFLLQEGIGIGKTHE